MLRYIRSEARNKWLETICNNKHILQQMLPMTRYRYLEELAKPIKGIGPGTIWETHVWFNDNFDRK